MLCHWIRQIHAVPLFVLLINNCSAAICYWLFPLIKSFQAGNTLGCGGRFEPATDVKIKSFQAGNTLGCGGRFEPATDVNIHVMQGYIIFKIFQEILKKCSSIIWMSATGSYCQAHNIVLAVMKGLNRVLLGLTKFDVIIANANSAFPFITFSPRAVFSWRRQLSDGRKRESSKTSWLGFSGNLFKIFLFFWGKWFRLDMLFTPFATGNILIV